MYSTHPHNGSYGTSYSPPEPSALPQQMVDTMQVRDTELMGRPIHFATGQFAGQTIRAELHEVQKADLGRKYARVDRRPLDPPPVVQLRLFQVFQAGTERQSEEEISNYDEVQALGFVCTVDLFPIPHPEHSRRGSRGHESVSTSPTQPTFPASPTQHHQDSRQHTFTFIPPHVHPGPQNAAPIPLGSVPPLRMPQQASPAYLLTPQASNDVVHRFDNFPVTESSKNTPALVGATFVQPSCVEYLGRKSLMFVFADLAVKTEGTFILRYRTFDLFSKPYNHNELFIQAECYGGMFRVYSTKEFPGLQASTELTKQLARWGVRLNIRETERKRRKKGQAPSTSPPRGRNGLSASDNEDVYASDENE
ncbi:velvet factor-domain-containing protein [Infundibulicybe gibba]|nr:velvet factor-domain-containing protein [Infundibulicybe gibba]